MVYNMFELRAMSAPADNWGFRARAEAENRVYGYDGTVTEKEEAEADAARAETEAEELEDSWVPPCAQVRRITDNAATAGQMVDLLKLHRAEYCAVCNVERKPAAFERMQAELFPEVA